MTPIPHGSSGSSSALQAGACAPETVHALSNTRRRHAVRALLGDHSRSVEELGTALSSVGGRRAGGDDDWADPRISLEHVHLPVLEATGLVTVGRDRGTVALADHPDLVEERVTLDLLDSVDGAVWRALDAVHGDRLRTELLIHLHRAAGPVTLPDLATAVGRQSVPVTDGEGGDEADDVDAVAILVHHIHLPKLADVGLLDYDVETGSVSFAGEQWFTLRGLLAVLPTVEASALHR